jgi:hypothetical protein
VMGGSLNEKPGHEGRADRKYLQVKQCAELNGI